MYNYLMNVTASNKNAILDDSMVSAIKAACMDANETTNSIRYGRTFNFESQIDEHTVQLRLTSETPIIPTRSISSITRALIRICPYEKLEPLKYNGSLLKATLVKEYKEGSEVYANLNPYEIVQAVIEIFFGHSSLRNNEKKIARDCAEQIKEVVLKYKTNIRGK